MTEHQIQSAFIQWVRLAEKQDGRLSLLFAVPNGGQRNIVTAVKLKREGVKPGVPDIMFPLVTEWGNGLAIEFKKPKTGRVSEDQIGYIELLKEQKWLVKVCSDADSAVQAVKNYLSKPA
jgi:hypothetical protein